MLGPGGSCNSSDQVCNLPPTISPPTSCAGLRSFRGFGDQCKFVHRRLRIADSRTGEPCIQSALSDPGIVLGSRALQKEFTRTKKVCSGPDQFKGLVWVYLQVSEIQDRTKWSALASRRLSNFPLDARSFEPRAFSGLGFDWIRSSALANDFRTRAEA
jgi:hypothetical protein